MILRAFRPADLGTLYEIDQSCFPAGISYTQEELGRFIAHKNSRTWVAEEDEEIAGFIVVDRQPEKVGHIITVDVAGGFRQRGVGTLLMDAAEAWFRELGFRLIYLEAAENNLAAQHFYLARGYRKAETIANYYADGSSAWIMVRTLRKPVES